MAATFILILPMIASFCITLFFLPLWIRKAQLAGLTGKDMNKWKKPDIAEAGGTTVIAGFILGVSLYIALKTFYFHNSVNVLEIFALISSTLIVSFIGIIDDILGWKIGLGRRVRILLTIIAAIPLMIINAGESSIYLPFLEKINIGIFYPLIIIPIGVIGASTTFNFLAGYNGLEARQGILLLSALALATWFTGNSWLTIVSLCMIASLLAFLLFNNFPAQVFPGDVMTYAIGALIASIAILGNLEKFTVFIFIPYIIEVLLKIRGNLKKESFALPKEDGSLQIPYSQIYGLEHFAIFIIQKYKHKVYEIDIVKFINILQILFIAIAFIIFRKGIFS